MERIVHTDEQGRKYDAWKNDEGMIVVIGPPEGLVDELKLPEPAATNLHNALHRRKILTYRDATNRPKELTGALQEAMRIDTQRLHEAYYRFSQELEF